MSLGTTCNTQACQCTCCNVPCMKPVRNPADGKYYYYGINALSQKVKLLLVTTATTAIFVPQGVICQLPVPPVPQTPFCTCQRGCDEATSRKSLDTVAPVLDPKGQK